MSERLNINGIVRLIQAGCSWNVQPSPKITLKSGLLVTFVCVWKASTQRWVEIVTVLRRKRVSQTMHTRRTFSKSTECNTRLVCTPFAERLCKEHLYIRICRCQSLIIDTQCIFVRKLHLTCSSLAISLASHVRRIVPDNLEPKTPSIM